MNVTPFLFLAGSAVAVVGSAVRVVAEHDRRVESDRDQYPLGAREIRPGSATPGPTECALLTAPRCAVPEQRHAPAAVPAA